MALRDRDVLRVALPSDGALYEDTMAFFQACGLAVKRPNARRYTGSVPAVPGVEALFQRASDITRKVEEGSADLGVTGLDRYLETRIKGGDALLVAEDLRYGRCELVLAVPESWVDVQSTEDLADLAMEFRQTGRTLRIATKFPRLVQRHLASRGVTYATLVPASGGLEAAPAAGYADMIADLTATGTTLKENRLKAIEGGTILSAQACVVGNRARLAGSKARLDLARQLLERMEAHLRAQSYASITANIPGDSEETVARRVLGDRPVAGIRGPTVARVYTAEDEPYFAVTVVVPQRVLQEAVDHLRSLGGSGVTVSKVDYVFEQSCATFEGLLRLLREGPRA